MFKRILRKILTILKSDRNTQFVTAEITQIAPHSALSGKRILITGATKGLGLSMAKKFLSEKAEVIITGRREEITRNIAAQIGCSYITIDLQDTSSIEEKFNSAIKLFGPIDCLVNNAGISLHEPTFLDVTPESFEKQFSTNLIGPFFLTQSFVNYLKHERREGNILFISSETGFTADIRPYGLTKAALNSFVKGLACALVKDHIRVNALAPGVVATEMTGFSPDNNLAYPHNSIGRLYLPEEIAEVAAFLISDASFCISGQIIGCNNARTVNARWK